MAASITKINKKLASLKSAKAKEEQRHKEQVEKLTAKYAQDAQALKDNYELKLMALKEDNANKLNELNPEIEFYTKQKNAIEKLQAQLENLDRATDERLGRLKEESEQVEEVETVEETEMLEPEYKENEGDYQ